MKDNMLVFISNILNKSQEVKLITCDNKVLCYQAANTTTAIVASAYESQAFSLVILILEREPIN